MKVNYCHKYIHERVQDSTAQKLKKPIRAITKKRNTIKRVRTTHNHHPKTIMKNLILQKKTH